MGAYAFRAGSPPRKSRIQMPIHGKFRSNDDDSEDPPLPLAIISNSQKRQAEPTERPRRDAPVKTPPAGRMDPRGKSGRAAAIVGQALRENNDSVHFNAGPAATTPDNWDARPSNCNRNGREYCNFLHGARLPNVRVVEHRPNKPGSWNSTRNDQGVGAGTPADSADLTGQSKCVRSSSERNRRMASPADCARRCDRVGRGSCRVSDRRDELPRAGHRDGGLRMRSRVSLLPRSIHIPGRPAGPVAAVARRCERSCELE